MKGGDPMRTYTINGEKVSNQEYIDHLANKKTQIPYPKIKGDPMSKENQAILREWYNKNKGKN